MIRAAAILALLSAVPAVSQEGMKPETCAAGWSAFAELLDMPSHLQDAGNVVTRDGWCRIDRTTARLGPRDFDALTWRAGGVEQAIERQTPPQSIDAVFTGIQVEEAFGLKFAPGRSPAPASLTLRIAQMPGSGALELDELSIDFGLNGRIALTGRGTGFNLSSKEAMLTSVGGMRVQQLDITAQLSPDLSRALSSLYQDRHDEEPTIEDLINLIPQQSLPWEDRAELRAFVMALPGARGRLDLKLRSDSGLGFMQLAGGGQHLWQTGGLKEAFDIWFNGLDVRAKWHQDH